MLELELQDKIRAAIVKDGRIRIFRNAVGQTGSLCNICRGKACGKCKKRLGVVVKYGLTKGSGDLIGIVKGSGKFISFEIKTPKGTIKPEQHAWVKFITDWGGYACIVRSIEEALEHVEKACT